MLQGRRRDPRPPADVVFAKRRIFLPDGEAVEVLEEPNHVDTSCFWFLPGSFHLLHYWAIMPSGLSPACDTVFNLIISNQSLIIRNTEEITVNFSSNYEAHYRIAGKPPPRDAKLSVNLDTVIDQIKQLDSNQRELIVRRCGFDIILEMSQNPKLRSRRNSICFCGSGRKFKHYHGRFAVGQFPERSPGDP